jgi:hypothetical protein
MLMKRTATPRPRVVVLVPCSGSKAVEPLTAWTAASLPRDTQDEVALTWRRRLQNVRVANPAPELLAARDLYTGRAFQVAVAACERWRESVDCRLYVVSAGLGLVPEDSIPVPAYGLSVSAKGDEDIRARVEGKFDPAEWWRSVAAGPYSAAAVSQGAAFAEADLVVLALSGPYMEMAGQWLAEAAATRAPYNLRVVGSPLGMRPEVVVPYNRELDKQLPGTGFDLSARALWHFATWVWPRAPYYGGKSELEHHRRLVSEALGGANWTLDPAQRPVPMSRARESGTKGLIF